MRMKKAEDSPNDGRLMFKGSNYLSLRRHENFDIFAFQDKFSSYSIAIPLPSLQKERRTSLMSLLLYVER